MPHIQDSLLSIVEQYLALTGLPVAAFGRQAFRDPWLISKMQAGQPLSEAVAHSVLDHMIADLMQRTDAAAPVMPTDRPVFEVVA